MVSILVIHPKNPQDTGFLKYRITYILNLRKNCSYVSRIVPQSVISLGGKDKVYGSINWFPDLIDVPVVISS